MNDAPRRFTAEQVAAAAADANMPRTRARLTITASAPSTAIPATPPTVIPAQAGICGGRNDG